MSAVFPALLAAVSVILTRDRPAPLLLAFYVGGLVTSVTIGILLLKLVGPDVSKLGNRSDSVSPAVAIAGGVVAFMLAWLLGSSRGRALIESWRERRAIKHPKKEKSGSPWMVRVLDRGSVKLAFLGGAILNLPGPFYLLSLGDIATGHYSTPQQILLVVLFNLIMFTLIEVPLVGYVIDPQKTELKVNAVASWLKRNGMRIIAAFCFFWGVSELVAGVEKFLS